VDAAPVELAHLGGRGGLHHTITLAAGEYLIGVSGRCGRYIDSIRFHTNQRVTDSYGGSGGQDEYRFEAAPGAEIVGLTGRADWFIDQLGVIVRARAGEASAAPAVLPAAAIPAAAPAELPPAKPAARSRKKTAPAADLVGLPDAAPVTPPAPDLVAIPGATLAAPPAPDLVGIPDSAPVEATAPELVGIPDSAPIAVEAAAVVTGERTASIDLGAKAAPDDLTKIEGIGPKVEQVLADAGITTFAQLAATPAPRLRQILDAAGSRYRITDPTTWPDQAAFAAAGDWASFNELVGKLKGGRRG
jgi:predicted flap endonuclease-1-like 5' DNA nuclease